MAITEAHGDQDRALKKNFNYQCQCSGASGIMYQQPRMLCSNGVVLFMRYNFFSYIASLELALTRVGYYEYKSYHGQARSGLGNAIFHEVRSKFFHYCNLGTNRREQSWTNNLKANAFSNKSCYTRDVFFEVFPNSCQQNFSLPVFLFQKKSYFLLKCQLQSDSQGANECHREVFIILRQSITEVSQHTLATLCFAKGVREICQIPLLLCFSGSGALPPVIKVSLGPHWTQGFSQWGKKTMSDIYKTILSAVRASREKQSWRNNNIPHDLHKQGRKGQKKWSAGSEEVTEGRPGMLLQRTCALTNYFTQNDKNC